MANAPENKPMTSAAMPKPPVPPPAFVDDDSDIIACDLTAPEFTNIRAASPDVKLRYVNCAVLGSNTPSLRFEQCKGMGFEVASLNDVHPEDRFKVSGYAREGNTKIINGDVILMKISRKKILGKYKMNEQQAQRLGSRASTIERGRKFVRDEVSAKNPTAENAGKISVFAPSQADTEALLGKD